MSKAGSWGIKAYLKQNVNFANLYFE